MNLVGKKLCRYHYNKLIVNENHRLARAVKKQQCAHPKHEEYTKNNNKKGGRPRKNILVKIPKRLQPILDLLLVHLFAIRVLLQWIVIKKISNLQIIYHQHKEYRP